MRVKFENIFNQNLKEKIAESKPTDRKEINALSQTFKAKNIYCQTDKLTAYY